MMTLYRSLVARGETPAEREAILESGVVGAREHYGLDIPKAIPKFQHEEYESAWSSHEGDFLHSARIEGFDKATAGALRDYGIDLGLRIAERGTGLKPEEAEAVGERLKGLSKAQQDLLLTWFKEYVVGGPAT